MSAAHASCSPPEGRVWPRLYPGYVSEPEEQSDDQPVTGNAFLRGARLAALPASFAARTTWGLGKRMVGAPAQAVLTDVQRRTADQIFSVLGQLKGGAMKFGQAMSVFEAALPDELAGPYRDALTRLQDAAPPMPASTVHRVMKAEFGATWRDRFPVFEDHPSAAASIGQVHKAVYDDGDEQIDVAVKLQYPGAGDALMSDLKQISRLARLFAVLAPGMDVKALVTELRERVAEELDYGREAEAQRIFAEEFADDQVIVVPRPVTHTEHALVSEWLESEQSLADIIDRGTQEQRDEFGEAFVRFLFAGPSRIGLLHADPHPGNFRVLSSGRLGVVDYGAVARLPDGLPPIIGQLLRAAVEEDYEAVTEGLRAEGFLRGADLDPEVMARYLNPLIEPARSDAFTFSRSWLRSQGQRLSRPDAEGLGTARQINIPPEYLLIHRVWMGGVGVLCQLGATAPFRSILAEYLPGFDD